MQFKNTIGYLLHELAHLVDAESDQVLLERLGIGFAQFKVLLVLEEQNGITQKRIAHELSQTEPSISRQIKILISKNLVKIVLHENKREHPVYITDRGMQMIEKASNALNSYHGPMFGSLSEKQQIQLLGSLKTIRSRVKS